jgi:hypothetical protein
VVVTAPARVDVLSWIYKLTKDKKIGKEHNGSHNTPNNSFYTTVRTRVLLTSQSGAYDVPAGSEMVVYRQLKKYESGGFGPSSSLALATIFVKENGQNVRQITIRMNGRIASMPMRQ